VGRPKSVLVTMSFTEAGSSHDCRADESHRIKKGVKRLTISEDRAKLNYCLPCAKKFIELGIERLTKMQSDISALLNAQE
jgi:hypothetical protein